jgi:hypothetical protein
MSLGLMTSAIVWFATAGLLHMTLPFLGEEFSIRECLIFSGLAAIPKLFGAIMATLYAVLTDPATGAKLEKSIALDVTDEERAALLERAEAAIAEVL